MEELRAESLELREPEDSGQLAERSRVRGGKASHAANGEAGYFFAAGFGSTTAISSCGRGMTCTLTTSP